MWTSDAIIKATSGKLHGQAFDIQSVVIDSRQVTQGALFVAFKGTQRDGHEFVKEALLKGATAALVEKIPEGLPDHTRLIVVPDVYEALVQLAHAARARTAAKIIAVTGSVGKTGAKEAIRLAASSSRSVYATQGNLNNHIGLPLSLVNMPPETAIGVFELGMNHAGEIAFLTKITKPHIAIITTIEPVHLEFFKNMEGIADAKAEIMEGLPADGTIILNRDNAFYDYLRAKAASLNIPHVLTFGTHEEANYRLVSYHTEAIGSRVEARADGTAIVYQMGTIGAHWAMTSLAALAAVTTAGVDLADAASAFERFHEPSGRGRVSRIAIAHGSITMIDDSYNASPASMRAGIAKMLEIQKNQETKGRTIAILGDMLELGDASVELHLRLASDLQQSGIDKLFAVGTFMKHTYDAVPEAMRAGYATGVASMIPTVLASLHNNDIVLLKGSHSIHMESVLESLLKTPTGTKESRHAV